MQKHDNEIKMFLVNMIKHALSHDMKSLLAHVI